MITECNFKTHISWNFPGGPVVKTPCFHCRGLGFYSWLGNYNKIPHSSQCGQKGKKINKYKLINPSESLCCTEEINTAL